MSYAGGIGASCAGYGGIFTSTGVILVLFILLVDCQHQTEQLLSVKRFMELAV